MLTGGAIAGIIAAVVAIAGLFLNYYQQRKQQKWQQEATKEAWAREDSAVTRRIQDLKRAGLSPTLAAGSAAVSSQPGQIAPAQLGLSDAANLLLNTVQMKKNFEVSDSQIALNTAQIDKATADSKKATADAATKIWDLSRYKKSGLPTNASSFGKFYNDTMSALEEANKKKPVFNKETGAYETYDIFGNKKTIPKHYKPENKKPGFVNPFEAIKRDLMLKSLR